MGHEERSDHGVLCGRGEALLPVSTHERPQDHVHFLVIVMLRKRYKEIVHGYFIIQITMTARAGQAETRSLEFLPGLPLWVADTQVLSLSAAFSRRISTELDRKQNG